MANVAIGTKVDYTRQVNTTDSLQGGGNLSADRTLSLDGDEASPGNAEFYGTNNAGTKGWNPLTLENRTSDPGSPAVGQLWLRTDL